MQRLQFRRLYREFLFRTIDLELLAPQGNMSKLLGQFATLLVLFSFWILFPAVVATDGPPSEMALLAAWTTEHLLISTTMLVTGIFAVLSWETMFPDRRDVMVLAPLPVRARVLFAAKIAAVVSALSVTVFCLDVLPGLVAPFAFSSAPALPEARYSSAQRPVRVQDLQAVMDHDMEAQRDSPTGDMALGRDAGIAIGVVQKGVRRVFTYGTAKSDSIFEIGSVSKTFTGLLLARAVEDGRVTLREPVRELLPRGTVAKPTGDEITLLDLATQHSGLPRMPDNFQPADRANPYADYGTTNLYAYIARRGVSKTKHPAYLYSNLGFGLLGQALAERSGTSYAALLRDEITGPLRMFDTVLSPSPEQRERFIQGHSGVAPHKPVHVWDIHGLAGAGAIRSTAGDMLTYLQAQLHSEEYGELASALKETHQIRDETSPGHSIGLGWQFEKESQTFEHGGATAGYTSYAFFCPKSDYAAVVLINTGPNLALPAEELGGHIRQRLAGEPAISLAKRLAARKSGLFSISRAFFAYWMTLFSAGAFVLCSVLTVQGVAQLLPRQTFLRVSSVLQMLFFCSLVLAYFLQPPFAGMAALADQQEKLGWVPSYWFLALFQKLNGPLPELFEPLWHRALGALAISVLGAVAAYAICYFRTIRKIAEQPDILPISRRTRWLPRFGTALETTVAHFAIRTLVRSRQHRVVLGFYLGISLGLTFFISKAPFLREPNQTGKSLVILSFLLMYSAIVGLRAVFSLPLELRANWIFQVVPAPNAIECLAATRRAMYGLALIPVLGLMAALTLWQWPWRVAVLHLLILFVFGSIVCEFALNRFPKIPFTCSYLPGKSSFHLSALVFIAVASRLNKIAEWERDAFVHPGYYVLLLAVSAAVFTGLRWRNAVAAQSYGGGMRFEDEAEPAVIQLGLSQDGVPIAPPLRI